MAYRYGEYVIVDEDPWFWSDFDDWDIRENNFPSLITNGSDDNNLFSFSKKQENIIEANSKDLIDKSNWNEKAYAFEELLDRDFKNGNLREFERQQFAIRFDGTNFTKKMDLTGRSFPCAVSFNSVAFKKGVSFKGANFKSRISFCKTEFEGGETSFSDSTIQGDVYFTEAKFRNDFIARRAKFEGEVFFKGGRFESNVSFDSSQCEKGFLLYMVNFSKKFSASDMSVKGNLLVRSAFDKAIFQRLVVEGSVSFLGSSFIAVPNFRDSKLNRPPEVAGMIVPPPKMYPFKWFNFTESKDKSDVAKYRKLKAMALAANDHEKDGEFFAYEMMAKRGYETTGFGPLLLNSLYWRWSDYGQSVWRPVKAMLKSWLFFWLFYIYTIGFKAEPWDRLCFSTIHSIQNLVPLIGTLFRTTSVPEGHTSFYDDTYHQLVDNGLSIDGWAALSALQQIIGAVLFFLLFLGLRNKFRLK